MSNPSRSKQCRIVATCCWFVFAVGVTFAEQRVVVSTSLELTGELSNNREVTVALKQQHVGEPEPYDSNHWYWGKFYDSTDLVVTSLSVRVDSQDVDVPRTAFEDLWNVILPAGVYLTENGDSVAVYLEGGDGEAAYTSRMLIHNLKVVRRATTGEDTNWDDAEIVEFPDTGK